MINGTVQQDSSALNTTLAIDVYTPGNQWIINEGVRPLMISHFIDNSIKYDFNQTGGVKYRMTDIINSQLSDILLGYRMIYEVMIDE